MKHLWAPWRMEFIKDIKQDRDDGCVFCEIAEEGDDRERLVLHRAKHCYVVMNRYPYNNGHLMIIPYRHLSSLKELKTEELSEMMTLTSASVEILQGAIEAEGCNCGLNIGRAAGAGIDDHIHMHIVPRWFGDNNFMPVLGDTRSMPEYLLETYDRLAADFKELAR